MASGGQSEKLAVYIHRAKGSADAAARAVNQALDDPGVFVFGELFKLQVVQSVSAAFWRVEVQCRSVFPFAAIKWSSLPVIPATRIDDIWKLFRFETEVNGFWSTE
jgi:hypothetical protein